MIEDIMVDELILILMLLCAQIKKRDADESN